MASIALVTKKIENPQYLNNFVHDKSSEDDNAVATVTSFAQKNVFPSNLRSHFMFWKIKNCAEKIPFASIMMTHSFRKWYIDVDIVFRSVALAVKSRFSFVALNAMRLCYPPSQELLPPPLKRFHRKKEKHLHNLTERLSSSLTESDSCLINLSAKKLSVGILKVDSWRSLHDDRKMNAFSAKICFFGSVGWKRNGKKINNVINSHEYMPFWKQSWNYLESWYLELMSKFDSKP